MAYINNFSEFKKTILDYVDNSWKPFFMEEFKKPYMKQLFYKNGLIFNATNVHKIFKVFKLTNLNQLKVVIPGTVQIGPNYSESSPFSCDENFNHHLSPPCVIVGRELSNNSEESGRGLAHSNLDYLHKQGVFLWYFFPLKSHLNEWLEFAEAIYTRIIRLFKYRFQKYPICFCLWGDYTLKFFKDKLQQRKNNQVSNFLVVKDDYPYTGSNFGSKNNFELCNLWLSAYSITPITWSKKDII